jgi:hypothetical protein
LDGRRTDTVKIDEFLATLFDHPSGSEAGTAFFKGMRHDKLLEMFAAWFRLNARFKGVTVNILNLQGIHDRGIDLIVELSGTLSARLGVQIKCDNDLEKNLNQQVNETLANYDTFNLDTVLFVFCSDDTNRSRQTKVRQEIARIQQKTSARAIHIIDPTKALPVFKELVSIPSYLEQFTSLPEEEVVEFTVTDLEEHESGFPIVHIESPSFVFRPESISLVKAYLWTIVGLAASDVLQLGYLKGDNIAYGACPIDRKNPLGVTVGDRTFIVPNWFIIGLENHGPISFWGTNYHPGGSTLRLFLQFLGSRMELEKGHHYQFVSDKFAQIVQRLVMLGTLRCDVPWQQVPSKGAV